MILVTGANGQYGSATINYLLEKGLQPEQVSGMVRNGESVETIKTKGVKTRMGDYNDYPSLVNAFTGINKLLFISGSDIPGRMTQHENVIKAAKYAGVKHIIYTSFQIKNETDSSPLWLISRSHLETEKWIKESGMNYTILKNSLYMDLIPAFVGENVLNTGMIYLPAENGKVAAVLRAEMAEATANIITGTNHEGKVYNFANTDAFTYEEVARLISEITGKRITYVSPTADEYARTLSQLGVPANLVELFSSFALAQARGELDGASIDLEQILGRKATPIKTYLNQLYSR